MFIEYRNYEQRIFGFGGFLISIVARTNINDIIKKNL